jgi:hypothetical protein
MGNRSARESRAVYESVLAARLEIAVAQKALVADQIRRDAHVTGCRECRTFGRPYSPATVALFGILSLCQTCADTFTVATIDFGERRSAVFLHRYCKRCYKKITTNDNLAEQTAMIGKFSGYCKFCWNSRRVEIKLPGQRGS